MKKKSIKSHLSKYSLVQKRSTTINHAFASALAPFDVYDENKINAAITFLGQDPESDLTCVFCGNAAETWDHLVSLVEGGKLRGLGHQIGNLVPCCKLCNSQKGAKDFAAFIKDFAKIKGDRSELASMLTLYVKKFAKPVNTALFESCVPEQWFRYNEIKKEIIDLLKEADGLAEALREKVRL